MNDFKNFIRLIWGLLICSVGIYLEVQANVGLAPWDVFTMGLALHTGIAFGNAVLWVSVGVVVLDLVIREKLGVGTILNAVLIGLFIDLLDTLAPVPAMHALLPGVGVLLLGQLLMCIGTCYYMRSGWGCGPRDALMVAISRNFPKIPIGLARFAVEATVLVLGWLMGGPVGVGTALSMFGVSFLMQATFAVMRFDAKSVKHEDVLETFRRFRAQYGCRPI